MGSGEVLSGHQPVEIGATGSGEFVRQEIGATGSGEFVRQEVGAMGEGVVLLGGPPSKGETGIRPSPHAASHFEYPA